MERRIVHRAYFVAVLGVVMASSIAAQPATPSQASVAAGQLRDGEHDFDLLEGTWDGGISRFKPLFLGGSRPMSEHGGSIRMVVRPLAGGPALIAESETTWRDSAKVHLVTRMSYSRASRRWTIQRTNVDTGESDSTLAGSFTVDGRGALVGEFTGMREVGERMLLVRETWRILGIEHTWSLAFSADGGRNWNENSSSGMRRYRDAGPDASPLASEAARDTTVHRESAHTPEELRVDAEFRVNGPPSPATYCCSTLEMRRYIAPAGGAAALTDLFDRENEFARLARLQEYRTDPLHNIVFSGNVALLRDLDRPGEFVWLRAHFDDQGGERIKAYYNGSLWSKHVDAVERAGIKLGDAHLLSGAYPEQFGLALADPPVQPVDSSRAGLVVATMYVFRRGGTVRFDSLFAARMLPRILDAGARPIVRFMTRTDLRFSPGLAEAFVPLLFRPTDEWVWFAKFPDEAAYDRFKAKLERDAVWKQQVLPLVEPLFAAPPEVWRMVPIGRSRPFL